MLLSEDLKENLSIFSNNISYYYVFCVIISLIAVFVACFCQKNFSEVDSKQELDVDSDVALEAHDNTTDEEKSGLSGLSSDPSIPSVDSAELQLLADSPVDSASSTNSSANSVVTSERELLMDSIANRMTMDDIMNERKMERQQLEEIFSLVNDQRDIFKIDSVEDLEDQMKLYR